MIKKNFSERRFHTAGARIMASSRLPSDFFHPSRQKQTRENSHWSQRHEDMEGPSLQTHPDPLLFTFHRSSSEQKTHRREGSSLPQPPKHLRHKQSEPRLPRVSMLMKENRQWGKGALGSEKLRKLVKINNRVLRQSTFYKELPPITAN